MVAPIGTLKVNLPSKSVILPFWVPFTLTVAPIIGPWSSKTSPVTTLSLSCCVTATASERFSSPKLLPGHMTKKAKIKIHNLFFIKK